MPLVLQAVVVEAACWDGLDANAAVRLAWHPSSSTLVLSLSQFALRDGCMRQVLLI